MPDTLKTLRKILNDDILLPPPDDKGTLRVKEPAREAKIKTLDISGVPTDTIAFALDHLPNDKSRRVCFRQLSCYLDAKQTFVNKGCDLVIVSRFKQKWYVLILDLKSDKPRFGKTEAQLKNSRAFVAYILSLLDTHYPADAAPDPCFELAIVTTRTMKSRVYKPNEARFERESYRKVNPTQRRGDQAVIPFRKLIGI